MKTNRTRRSPKVTDRLFYQTKDVKSYLENFGRIDFAFLWCPKCGSFEFVRFGAYFRSKAGVTIQRFRCKKCGRCFNWLPPFLLPHKHYAVSDLAPAIEAYALGEKGLVKTWEEQEAAEFSLETFRRWVARFREMAPAFLKKVRKLLAEIKPGWRFEKDQRLFKAAVPASKEELYQLFVLRDYFTSLIAAEDYLPWLVFVRSTRFDADRMGLKRDNRPRAGPKRG